jgi:hypothetical protein
MDKELAYGLEVEERDEFSVTKETPVSQLHQFPCVFALAI